MKKLEDYTNEELSVLTDLEIENLIDIECMRAGVPLSIMPKPVLKEVSEIKEPTTEIYMIDNYYFTDESEANQMSALLSSVKSRVTTDYNYNAGGSSYKYYKKYDPAVSVKKAYCYSKEEYMDLLDILKTKRDIEDYNSDITKEYNDAISERRDTVDMVWDEIYNAKYEMKKINEALDIYKKYVELSGEDEDVAKKFFKQNEKVSEYMDIVLKKYSEMDSK
ncbi:MAG TPA: hypothetical protein GXZ90_05135 [Clostridiales bacterium]|nr:hypothetical protein [Clostridiales bacterium]